MAAQTHAQDLATQDRLTKNVKDILWLNTYAAGPNVSPSAALAALKVRGLFFRRWQSRRAINSGTLLLSCCSVLIGSTVSPQI